MPSLRRVPVPKSTLPASPDPKATARCAHWSSSSRENCTARRSWKYHVGIRTLVRARRPGGRASLQLAVYVHVPHDRQRVMPFASEPHARLVHGRVFAGPDPDPNWRSRFFARSGPHPLATVARTASGAAPEVDLLLVGVAPLKTADRNEVSFLDNRRYAEALEKTSAGAVMVTADMLARVPAGTVPIVTKAPYAGWASVARLFHPVAPPRPALIHRLS